MKHGYLQRESFPSCLQQRYDPGGNIPWIYARFPKCIKYDAQNSTQLPLPIQQLLCNIINMNRIYKIKKALKAPMILATLISIPIFADVVMRGFKITTLVMALSLMVLFYLLTLNNLLRKVRITDSEVTISGIFGPRRIPTREITLIDGMTMGTRQFITIATKKRSYLIPNSFEGLAKIIDDLMSVSPQETHGKALDFLKNNIVVRKSDIVGAWITVILLLIIILVRYFPL